VVRGHPDQTVEYLQEIYRFLGVDDQFVSEDHQKWYKFHYHKDDKLNEASLEDKSRKMWLEYYKPHTEELEKMTGKDLIIGSNKKTRPQGRVF
jgi:hypothetical protein